MKRRWLGSSSPRKRPRVFRQALRPACPRPARPAGRDINSGTSASEAGGAKFRSPAHFLSRSQQMPRGDKSKYSDKQKRQAEHIEEGYKHRGVPEDEAERRAWATVNRVTHGGKKSGGSGRGRKEDKSPMKKGGRLGGRAAAARPASERSASARKAARTRKARATRSR